MNYLAFDLGGSSGKMYLAALQEGKLELKEIIRIENHPMEVNGGVYWNFFSLYEGILKGIRKAVKETKDQIDSIGFDSFCNDFALVHEQGMLLSPIRCYRDDRTARHQKHMEQVMDPEELYLVNGNQRGLFNTLPQLDAMKQENQGWLLEGCDKLLFVSDLFIYCLTGQMRTEYTTASVTQMFDYETLDWSEVVLDRYGIRKSLFAPLVMPGERIGMTKKEINQLVGSEGMEVTAVCQHDTGSAFLASVSEEEQVIISAGTWSVIGCETEKPMIKKEGFAFNIANEGGYQGHHRILRNVMGTWILQELLREEKENGNPIDFGELDQKATAFLKTAHPVDVDQKVFYSLGGMREKVEDFLKCENDKNQKSIGEIAASVYLGLVYKYRFTIEKLEEYTGKQFKVINILGGGSQSELICQLIADVCQLPVEAGPIEATAYGNILVQMLAKGAVASVEEGRQLIRKSAKIRRYEPNGCKEWDGKYHAFIETIF